MNRKLAIFAVLYALCLLVPPHVRAQPDEVGITTSNEVLRMRVQGKVVLGEADLQQRKFVSEAAAMAEFRRNVVPIQHHASLQLGVEVSDARGRSIDVARHGATRYQSLAPSRLSVSSTGLVTAAPSADAPPALGGDLAVLVIHDHSRRPAWNKVFFQIVP